MLINENDIHIWLVNDQEITELKLLDNYLSILSEAELHQQQKFHFEKHRHQYLVTRVLLRCTLSFYINKIDPEQWVFKKNPYGKPYIHNSLSLPLRFNLSHTDNIIVLAVTLAGEIGIDVERLSSTNHTESISESYFSRQEVTQLNTLAPEMRCDRFFDLWTLKEAYIKADGRGLSIPLDQFNFSFSANNETVISFDPRWKDQPDNYHFWRIQPNDTHKIALALKSENIKNNNYSLSFMNTIPMRHKTKINLPYS